MSFNLKMHHPGRRFCMSMVNGWWYNFVEHTFTFYKDLVINILFSVKRVTVRTFKGDDLSFEFGTDQAIRELKTQIADRLFISPRDQTLILNNTLLRDEDCLPCNEMEPTNIPCCYLYTPSQLRVFIDFGKGFLMMANVETTATIAELKDIILQSNRIPVVNQRLYNSSSELQDHYTLGDCHVGYNATLQLRLHLKVTDLRQNITSVTMSISGTILDLKNELQNKLKLPASGQRIIFRRRELADGRSLMDCGIEKDPFCSVIENPLDLQIKISKNPGEVSQDEPMRIKVSHWDTGGSLIARLQKGAGSLICAGTKIVADTTLYEQKIPSGSTLHFIPEVESYKVTLRTNGNINYELDCEPSDTIREAKSKFEFKESVPAERQVWSINGNELDNGHRLQQCHIASGVVVDLVLLDPPRIPIKVKTSTENTYPLNVCETSTILDVKVSVEEALPDAPVDRQVLILDGNKLEDDRKALSHLRVTTESVFFLHVRTDSKDGKK